MASRKLVMATNFQTSHAIAEPDFTTEWNKVVGGNKSPKAGARINLFNTVLSEGDFNAMTFKCVNKKNMRVNEGSA